MFKKMTITSPNMAGPLRYRAKHLGVANDLMETKQSKWWVEGQLHTFYDRSGEEDRLYYLINNYRIDIETLCMFTGIFDKFGRRIFAGDIVKAYDRTWVVEWIPFMCKFEISIYTTDGKLWAANCVQTGIEFEVIGNIFDNEELSIEYTVDEYGGKIINE